MPPQANLDEDMDMADEDELGQPDSEPVDDADDTDDPINGPGVLGGQG